MCQVRYFARHMSCAISDYNKVLKGSAARAQEGENEKRWPAVWLPRGMAKGQGPREAVPGAKAGRNAPRTAGLSGGWRGFAIDQVRGPSHTEVMRSVMQFCPCICSRR